MYNINRHGRIDRSSIGIENSDGYLIPWAGRLGKQELLPPANPASLLGPFHRFPFSPLAAFPFPLSSALPSSVPTLHRTR